MAITWRSPGVFIAGLLLGGLGAWALLGQHAERASAGRPAGAMTSAAPMGGAPVTTDCGSSLLLSRGSGTDDGTESLVPAPKQATKAQVSALIVRGKEAAAGGRERDAEALFMNACRSAQAIAGAHVEPQADAMYNLARLYARQEGAGRAVQSRARELYAASLQGFRNALGTDAEKTRYAAEGLAALGGGAAVAESRPNPAPEKPVVAAKPNPPAEKTERKAAAQQPAAQVVAKQAAPDKPAERAPAPKEVAPQPAREAAAERPEPPPAAVARADARPSFDCARARSPSEKIICADPDLARQDRELGQVFARAKAAAPDARAFQRESDAQWARREAECRDRECLQRWYAQRREQLGGAGRVSRATQAAAEPPTMVQPTAQASGDAYAQPSR